MTAEAFSAWLNAMDWTKARAARELDVHPNTVHTYTKEGAPKLVRLACLALFSRLNIPKFPF